MVKLKEHEARLQIISEVANYIMRFADYSTEDVFRIPLDIMKSLKNGIIPHKEDKDE